MQTHVTETLHNKCFASPAWCGACKLLRTLNRSSNVIYHMICNYRISKELALISYLLRWQIYHLRTRKDESMPPEEHEQRRRFFTRCIICLCWMQWNQIYLQNQIEFFDRLPPLITYHKIIDEKLVCIHTDHAHVIGLVDEILQTVEDSASCCRDTTVNTTLIYRFTGDTSVSVNVEMADSFRISVGYPGHLSFTSAHIRCGDVDARSWKSIEPLRSVSHTRMSFRAVRELSLNEQTMRIRKKITITPGK